MIYALTVASWSKVIHKNLWISKVIHALTLAGFSGFYALTLAGLRINSRAPINTSSYPLLLNLY